MGKKRDHGGFACVWGFISAALWVHGDFSFFFGLFFSFFSFFFFFSGFYGA